MNDLCDVLRDRIACNGPLTVAEYMELALQHPLYGYYRAGDPLGRDGDFTTAPEISQMFGEMIGLWCADMWQRMGRPSPFALAELGPGRGTLMQDVLRATAKVPDFHAQMNLCLMESNATLRTRQGEKLDCYKPCYIDDLAQLPAMPTLMIANEFFDALPIRQFEKTTQGWCERMVTWDGAALAFTLCPATQALMEVMPPAIREKEAGAVYEISFPSLKMARDIGQHLGNHGGAMLAIDYGYTDLPMRPTFQAIAKHEYANPLACVGERDLTAHVDFGALQRATRLSGPTPITQGEFLRNLGIEIRAAQLKHRATPEQAQAIDAALHRLTDPMQMGNLFKVMCVAGPSFQQVTGFP